MSQRLHASSNVYKLTQHMFMVILAFIFYIFVSLFNNGDRCHSDYMHRVMYIYIYYHCSHIFLHIFLGARCSSVIVSAH